ncbi:homeodomain-interacting protein kinase 4-like [Bombina bombina]|uniref:homeodomain-interacting protein kinase 4-like n=1 Tax=Bombina bombina TaxID=8345 RepID=UPI00235AC83C|nr:homeodomain-interacting protein kinase 4-like [Bombina bombina]
MECVYSDTDCYEIINFLGEGTFGEVVKGRKRSNGEFVAIKIHKNNVSRSETIYEINMLSALRTLDSDKSHIVRFYEYFNDHKQFYLVFEELEKNLIEFQMENDFAPLHVRHIRTITMQVLKALSKLKELSILHTDLKPQNIMLVNHARYPFRIKIIDFGSASYLKEIQNVKEPYIQTRFYRSPEILLGVPCFEKVDIWSLGCIIAELNLGHPLYPGESEYDQIRYICHTQGMPSNRLLEAGRKSFRFFNKETDTKWRNIWKLKPKDEYPWETKIKHQEKKKTILKSLDQVRVLHTHNLFQSNAEYQVQQDDLNNMIDLIKKMLTWDPNERINPGTAMEHPYISLLEMKKNYKKTNYYHLSKQSLKRAYKKIKRVPNNTSDHYTASKHSNPRNMSADIIYVESQSPQDFAALMNEVIESSASEQEILLKTSPTSSAVKILTGSASRKSLHRTRNNDGNLTTPIRQADQGKMPGEKWNNPNPCAPIYESERDTGKEGGHAPEPDDPTTQEGKKLAPATYKMYCDYATRTNVQNTPRVKTKIAIQSGTPDVQRSSKPPNYKGMENFGSESKGPPEPTMKP